MKFLHLSDLHIGKTVNHFPMLQEQQHAFQQILHYIQAEKPDAVLIAGDVYDRAVPGVEAVRLFDDFLTALASTGTAVLLISGNHDSPERLHYASRLLSEQNLHLCGRFDGKLHSVTLTDVYGEVHFWLLPFIRPAVVRGMFPDTEIESYTDAVRAALGTADIDPSQRNVLLSHQFYTGSGIEPIRSESEINPIGGLDAVDASLLAPFDYVALGHLHRAQGVSPIARYAGSMLKYSLSERLHEKSVTLVELGEKGVFSYSKLPLTPLRDMREIRGTLDELLSPEVSSQGNKDDYLRVILTDTEDIIDPAGKLRSVYPHVMDVFLEHFQKNQEALLSLPDMDSPDSLSLYDLFSEFFLESSGAVMTDAQAKIVQELLDAEVDA